MADTQPYEVANAAVRSIQELHVEAMLRKIRRGGNWETGGHRWAKRRCARENQCGQTVTSDR